MKSGADGDTDYTVTITPDPGEEDDVTITVNVNTVKDLALNNNLASDPTDRFHVDTIDPTVEVRTPEIEKNVAFDITIAFSEPVNGFEASDITITGPG